MPETSIMNKKFLQIGGVTVALLLVVMLPTPAFAKQTLKNTNQLVQHPAVGKLAPLWWINISIDWKNGTIKITYGLDNTVNALNIHVDGSSTTLRGRPRGNNTVNTTIPSMTPGQIVFIKIPAQKGLALMEYNIIANYQINGTMEQAHYGPDKYLLFFGHTINLKG